MQAAINILLVDDELRNLDALEVILEDPSYTLLRADNADKALRLLLAHDVAAIVLDIKMPGMSGLELAQLIKGTKKFREIPIVFMTAYMVDDQAVLSGYGVGAVDYLTKPVNPPILRHKIAIFADLFRKTRALAVLNETLEARVKERTAELEKSEAALRAASVQKDLFLATLAHELRNPLAPLRTGVDILLQLPDPSPIAIRALASMNRQLHHMVRLIDDLLDVSRISRGMFELKRETIEVQPIIANAIETAKPFMDPRKQSIHVNQAASVVVFVDPTRVSQIIANLLHNASKFSPIGATIDIAVDIHGGAARIRVVDRGAGIRADQIDRVFEMFARIEHSRPNPNSGLGIGLALGKQLAVMHGGTLTGESAGEGAGSTFTLSLPLPSPAQGSASEVVEIVGPAAAGTSDRLNVVVIEDNDDAADMLSVWLESMGHDVRVARTGPDGLELVREVRPDVVLCDIGLPGMDGVEVCKRVLGLQIDVRPTMVALTGWGMESDRHRTREAGFDHHLVKPVALDKLRQILVSARRA